MTVEDTAVLTLIGYKNCKTWGWVLQRRLAFFVLSSTVTAAVQQSRNAGVHNVLVHIITFFCPFSFFVAFQKQKNKHNIKKLSVGVYKFCIHNPWKFLSWNSWSAYNKNNASSWLANSFSLWPCRNCPRWTWQNKFHWLKLGIHAKISHTLFPGLMDSLSRTKWEHAAV